MKTKMFVSFFYTKWTTFGHKLEGRTGLSELGTGKWETLKNAKNPFIATYLYVNVMQCMSECSNAGSGLWRNSNEVSDAATSNEWCLVIRAVLLLSFNRI